MPSPSPCSHVAVSRVSCYVLRVTTYYSLLVDSCSVVSRVLSFVLCAKRQAQKVAKVLSPETSPRPKPQTHRRSWHMAWQLVAGSRQRNWRPHKQRPSAFRPSLFVCLHVVSCSLFASFLFSLFSFLFSLFSFLFLFLFLSCLRSSNLLSSLCTFFLCVFIYL